MWYHRRKRSKRASPTAICSNKKRSRVRAGAQPTQSHLVACPPWQPRMFKTSHFQVKNQRTSPHQMILKQRTVKTSPMGDPQSAPIISPSSSAAARICSAMDTSRKTIFRVGTLVQVAAESSMLIRRTKSRKLALHLTKNIRTLKR